MRPPSRARSCLLLPFLTRVGSRSNLERTIWWQTNVSCLYLIGQRNETKASRTAPRAHAPFFVISTRHLTTTVVASFYAGHSCSKRHCRRECRMTQNLQTRSMPFLVPQFLLRAHPVAARRRRRRRRRRRDIVSRFFDELHTRTTCLVPPDACRSDNIRHARIVRQQKVWALPNSITVTVCSYRSNMSCTISTHTCSS